MDFRTLSVRYQQRVALITLNRPEALNAMSLEMVEEMGALFGGLEEDQNSDVVVITGAGKAFMAGADLKGLLQRFPVENERYNQRIIASFNALELQSKPVIAAINGYAMGGGLELTLACSIRLAAASAKLGLPEVKLGILPGAGGTQRLPRLIGKGDAMRLLLTGDTVDAVEANRLGLVDMVFPDDELLPRAMEMAQRIAANAPLAVRAIKDAVEVGLNLDLHRAIRYTDRNLAVLLRSGDSQEGIRAFLEKRPPRFQGS